MSFSRTVENSVLNHLTGKAPWTPPAQIWVGLSSTDPGKTGSGITEPSGGGYSRTQMTQAQWTDATSGPGGEISNSAEIVFPSATANWLGGALLNYLVFFSAQSGGTFLGSRLLTVPRAVVNTNTPSFPVGGIDLLSIDDTTAPSIPSGLSASAVSSSQINLSWAASSDATGVTGYRIYRNGLSINTTTLLNYSDTGLTPSTLYQYNVAAFDAFGNQSAPSSSASATTQSSGGNAADLDFAKRKATNGMIRFYDFEDYLDMFGNGTTNRGRAIGGTSAATYDGSWFAEGSGLPGPFTHGAKVQIFQEQDSSLFASGSKSLHFRMPNFAGAGNEGQFRIAFTDNFINQAARDAVEIGEGGEVFVQIRVRYNSTFLKRYINSSGQGTAFKVISIGYGDISQGAPAGINDDNNAQSCSRGEIVVTGTPDVGDPIADQFGGVGGYHSCGSSPINPFVAGIDGKYLPIDSWVGNTESNAPNPGLYQSNIVGCNYPNTPGVSNVPPCIAFRPNEWQTILIHVIVGDFADLNTNQGVPNSRIQCYYARENQPYVLVFDTLLTYPTGFCLAHPPVAGYRYGKIWLWTYTTGRLKTQDRGGEGDANYDEALICRHHISAPGIANRTALDNAATPLTPGTMAVLHTEGQRGLAKAIFETPQGVSAEGLQYTDNMIFDTSTREFHAVGTGRSSGQQTSSRAHIRYSEDTDLWDRVGDPNNGGTSAAHGYKNATIIAHRSEFVFRLPGSSSLDKWSKKNGYQLGFATIPDGGNGQFVGTLCWFRDRRRMIMIDLTHGIWEWNPYPSAFQQVMTSGTLQQYMGNSGYAVYCPHRKSMFIGGGAGPGAPQGKIIEYKQDGTFDTAWPICPSPISFIPGSGNVAIPAWGGSNYEGMLTVDPISGHILAFHSGNSKKFLFELNQTTRVWTQRTDLEPNIIFWNYDDQNNGWVTYNTICAPCWSHGVILFVKYSTAGCRSWIYKHLPN